jgi:hypothetical protein
MARSLRLLLVLLLLMSTASKGGAQSSSPLQTLQEHFAGTWVGINHDYTVNPAITTKITITTRKDKREGRLDMEYAYVDQGKSTEKRYKRFVIFKPETSMVFIDRKGEGKQHLKADGLDELLRSGYGSFTLHGVVCYKGDKHAISRADYHLSPDSWSYEIYVSSFGGPFLKTGDWSLRRTSIMP